MRSTLDAEGGRAQLGAGVASALDPSPRFRSLQLETVKTSQSRFVGLPCEYRKVDVTESDIARVPVTNLRVPRAEFTVQWISAERRCDEQVEHGVTDWYAAGVAATCEWLATAVVRPRTGPNHLAFSPVTGRTARAYEELIEAECLAAEKLANREPRPATLLRRPGWIEGIVDTLNWAWRHAAPPPLLDGLPVR